MPTKLSVKKMDYNAFQLGLQQNDTMILFNNNINRIITILSDKYLCKFISKPTFFYKNVWI